MRKELVAFDAIQLLERIKMQRRFESFILTINTLDNRWYFMVEDLHYTECSVHPEDVPYYLSQGTKLRLGNINPYLTIKWQDWYKAQGELMIAGAKSLSQTSPPLPPPQRPPEVHQSSHQTDTPLHSSPPSGSPSPLPPSSPQDQPQDQKQ